jgi:ferredoxin-NADP reductase
MAKTKWATVTGHEDLGNNIHRIHCLADEPLDHVSGNYVILRSTLTNPEKPTDVIKKAYSISSNPDQENPLRFHFTIIDIGLMSEWLSSRKSDDRLEFSGPWGKKFRAQPEDIAETIHLFATGTGFSPIGAMALDRLAEENQTVNLWWQTDILYDQEVIRSLEQHSGFTILIGEDISAKIPADSDALYFMAGDGAVIHPLCVRLVEQGVPKQAIRTDYFFNKPPKT